MYVFVCVYVREKKVYDGFPPRNHLLLVIEIEQS